MSNTPTDPQTTGEVNEDLDVPAEQSNAVTGGITFNSSEDDSEDAIIMKARSLDD